MSDSHLCEKPQLSFEVAFQKLDELLKKLNNAETPLEEALKCYEEADGLIALCSERLGTAERRLEKLVKNRQGGIVFDENGVPKIDPFSIP